MNPKEYSEEEIQSLMDAQLQPPPWGRTGPLRGNHVLFYYEDDEDDKWSRPWTEILFGLS